MTDRYKEAIQGARDCVERNKDGGVFLPDLLRVIDSQEAEIERLNNNISAMAITLSNSAKETRAEAIKKFADRLKIEGKKNVDKYTPKGCDLYFENGTLCGYVAMKETIDNLVKEMVGEDK